MVHVLLVVSRDAPELLARFARQLAGLEGVKVLVDRRVGERRGATDRRSRCATPSRCR
ncbi:MAG TPA: hypothetical protein VGD07_24400 [Methylomirabilota bacterium]